MQVKITKEEIFYYVTGISSYDTLERIIDPTKYCLLEDRIIERSSGRVFLQDLDYVYYINKVRKLKKLAPEMQIGEIRRVCEEIEDISPTKINV